MYVMISERRLSPPGSVVVEVVSLPKKKFGYFSRNPYEILGKMCECQRRVFIDVLTLKH